jgi:hypothetical protein
MMSESTWQDLQLEIADMSLQGEYLTQAARRLEQVEKRTRLSEEDRIELARLQGELHIRRGNFAVGRNFLRKGLQYPKCKRGRVHLLRVSLANSFAYESEYKEAIDEYMKAQQHAIAELCRVAGERSLDGLKELLNRRFYGKAKEELIGLLWTLHDISSSRASCRKLLDLNPLEDLLYAQTVVEVIGGLDASSWDTSNYRGAFAWAALARFYFEKSEANSFEQATEKAIELYDNAIQSFEQTRNEDEQQSRVDLAWSYYGKSVCLLRKLRAFAGEDSGNCLDIAAEELTRMFLKFSEAGQVRFRKHFSRARELAQSDSEQYPDQLEQTVISTLESLGTQFPPSALAEVLETLRGLELPKAVVEPDKSGTDLPKLSKAAEERFAESDLDFGDMSCLHYKLKGLLQILASHKDQEEVNKRLSSAALKIAADDSLSRCLELFRLLSVKPSKQVRAEGNYGLACLFAIQGDGPRAAFYLRSAGEAVGENTHAYLNRARLDSDFDAIRLDEEFQALISRRQAVPTTNSVLIDPVEFGPSPR